MPFADSTVNLHVPHIGCIISIMLGMFVHRSRFSKEISVFLPYCENYIWKLLVNCQSFCEKLKVVAECVKNTFLNFKNDSLLFMIPRSFQAVQISSKMGGLLVGHLFVRAVY